MSVKDFVPWVFNKKRSVPVVRSDNPFVAFQHEMNRLFDQFVPSFFGETWPMGELHDKFLGFSPKIDVTENENEVVVKGEFPGMTEKDINLTLNDEGLVIEGEKRSQVEDKRDGRTYIESQCGRFVRTVPLSHLTVIEDKVEANFKDGVLTIKLPKAPGSQSKTKKIPVRGG